MAKHIALMLLLAVMATGCKKKKGPLPTTMTLVMGKDTLWTTTNVVTDNQNAGTVYINGTSPDGSQSLDITLSGFTSSKKTYTVDYRGPGGNMTGNTGHYRNGSTSMMARTGKITITDVSAELMKGTYDFYYLQSNFRGTFAAPLR